VLKLEFYGVLKQRVAPSVELEVPHGATVGEVLQLLREAYPALGDDLPRVACAQGDVLLSRDRPVDPTRPLVLLPPVSGG
jgi:sulfur-carrier protein